MLWHCNGCTTRYAATLDTCPQCGSSDRVEAHLADEAAPAEAPVDGDEQG